MMNLPRGVRIFVASHAADFRKSYDGLCALVGGELGQEPRSGDLFVFLNRRADQIKFLFWDRDGYCLFAKRLEAGTFRRVEMDDGVAKVEIDSTRLMLILEGMDATNLTKRSRYASAASSGNGLARIE
jgi:transposase